MSFTKDPLYVAGILCILLLASVLLSRKKGFKALGVPLLVIILSALAANLGIIPTATQSHPLYNAIFSYVAPIGIFILMLEVDLRSIRKAGTPMLMMFGIGSLATIIGVLTAWFIVRPGASLGPLAHAVAGMYTGTYIGGSINFNAVALHYGVSADGQLFAASTVVDNLIGTPWIIATLLLPRWLQKIWPHKKLESAGEASAHPMGGAEQIELRSLAVMAGLSVMALFAANQLNALFPSVPVIISLTSFALIVAQLPITRTVKGTHTVGLFLIFIFLAVVGTLCDVATLASAGDKAITLLVFVVILVLVHGLVIFGMGALLKQDWDLVAIASQANIGGNTTAIATAESLDRPDLLLPGMLAGSAGNALGTYAGFLVAGLLQG